MPAARRWSSARPTARVATRKAAGLGGASYATLGYAPTELDDVWADLYVDFHCEFNFTGGAISGVNYHVGAIFDLYANYGMLI